MAKKKVDEETYEGDDEIVDADSVEVVDEDEDEDEDDVSEGEIDFDDLPFTVYSPEQNLDNIKALVWGQSGVGKSVLSGSAQEVPEMMPVLHIDVEGGTLSLHGAGYNKVKVVRIRSFSDFGNVYNYLASNKNKFRTVIIDSFTELQKYCMDEILEVNDREDAQWKDWGQNASTLRKVIRWLRDLPINLICVCLETEEKDERTGTYKYKPQLPGKLAGEMAGYFDINVRYTMTLDKEGNEVRQLHTGAGSGFSAKDRTYKLPKVMHEPTMAKLYDIAVRGMKGQDN